MLFARGKNDSRVHSELSRQALVAGGHLKLQELSRVSIEVEQIQFNFPGQPEIFHVGLKVQFHTEGQLTDPFVSTGSLRELERRGVLPVSAPRIKGAHVGLCQKPAPDLGFRQ